MKKIIILFIGILLLSSCKSKRVTTRTHTNTRHIKDRAKEKTQTPTNNNQNSTTVVQHPTTINHPKTNEIIVSPNTIYDEQLIDQLYVNKPNLDPIKINYIKKFSKLAINEMEAYKIPASITLAQGLLESRYGQSELTKKSKNHFGIKCHKWTGSKVYHDDDAKGECFRKYDYDANSYRDHSLFLANKKRYAKLFTYAPNDYKSWARGLRKAGYATDKRYPQKLIDLIEKYNLYTFDKLVLGNDYKPEVKVEENVKQNNKYHIVEVGETLYAISGKYYVSVNDIKRFNQLKTNTISVGQKLKLFGKKDKKQIQLKQHIVKKGDTLYNISRKYKLTVEKIKTLNNLENNELSIGQVLIIE